MSLRCFAALIALSAVALARAQAVLDAVTFSADPGNVYVPVRDAAASLGWKFEYDEVTDLTNVNGKPLSVDSPCLFDGTHLASLETLQTWGARVEAKRGLVAISSGERTFQARIGAKRVSVDMREQILQAWQGDRLVFMSPVSTGRIGKETPNGSFHALAKDPDHRSSIYDSPMPWSVQVVGNIYVHGSESFYDNVGSHGCIRLPLTHGNLAKWFYDWVDVGTPIKVTGSRPQKQAPGPRSSR